MFEILQSFEEDIGKPDPQPMKNLLDDLQNLLTECFNINIPFSNYYDCVDLNLVIFPKIKDLIENAKTMTFQGIVFESLEIALTLTHGMSKCL